MVKQPQTNKCQLPHEINMSLRKIAIRGKKYHIQKRILAKIIQFDPRALLHEYSKYYGKGKIKETSQPQVEK